MPVVGDARAVLEALDTALAGWRSAQVMDRDAVAQWRAAVDAATRGDDATALPSDSQVIGAVQASFGDDAIVVCAAGGLPGELHKLWRAARSDGYHLEYGYSCMGYEIAGGLGVKLAAPDRDVVVMVGDGSYLMMNSELATSVMLGRKLIVVLLDNRGFGCINRLQQATGSPGFNNLLADARHEALPDIDFAAHARSLGALAEKAANLRTARRAGARAQGRPQHGGGDRHRPAEDHRGRRLVVDVAVPEVSDRPQVEAARRDYEQRIRMKRDLVMASASASARSPVPTTTCSNSAATRRWKASSPTSATSASRASSSAASSRDAAALKPLLDGYGLTWLAAGTAARCWRRTPTPRSPRCSPTCGCSRPWAAPCSCSPRPATRCTAIARCR